MYKTYFTGEIILHVAQIVNTRTAATLYTVETWFVSGIQGVPGGMDKTSGGCSLG